jgi:hypothetical protein
MLFRKGFLTVVIATGTLALGINMPCKTVVFMGDSVFLTALSYQQAAGRAGRRGFDVLGNVVFAGIHPERVYEIMSLRLPDLQGQFPLSTTLILRLMGLLHHTDGSQYAVDAVSSLLSQTRVYLGGAQHQMAIKHHVRFSIEYLRRQDLLSRDGKPLEFAGLVGRLYFTENAVFAFHYLLKEGYLSDLCRPIKKAPSQVMLNLILVLCHLFCRLPVWNHEDHGFIEQVVRPSTSVVILPPLPSEAETLLKQHNQDTLSIFKSYVETYVHQHLRDVPDNTLPFTKRRVGGQGTHSSQLSSSLGCLPPTRLRSPFSALSGFTDDFGSIQELCTTAHSEVFLEASSLPFIPIYPHDTGGVPWNSYIYDFFKHGSLDALVDANQIKRGDVWFHLKDFSLILATITASLSNFVNGVAGQFDMLDVEDGGGQPGGSENSDDESEKPVLATPAQAKQPLSTKSVPKKAQKSTVAESWEDEASSTSEDGSSPEDEDDKTPDVGSYEDKESDLKLVLAAFELLQKEFDVKLSDIGA